MKRPQRDTAVKHQADHARGRARRRRRRRRPRRRRRRRHRRRRHLPKHTLKGWAEPRLFPEEAGRFEPSTRL